MAIRTVTADNVNIDDEFQLGVRTMRVTENSKFLGHRVIAARPLEPLFDGDDIMLVMHPDSAIRIRQP